MKKKKKDNEKKERGFTLFRFGSFLYIQQVERLNSLSSANFTHVSISCTARHAISLCPDAAKNMFQIRIFDTKEEVI